MSEAILESQHEYLRFQARGLTDPCPAWNPLERRFARCLSCRGTMILHFSKALLRWVDDGGHFHSGHTLEFPVVWLEVAT